MLEKGQTSPQKFKLSLERFNQAWDKVNRKKRPENAPSLLEMDFFGTMTETTKLHDRKALAYEIGQTLGRPPYGYSINLDTASPLELEDRCKILDVLTQYIESGKIEPEKMKEMREVASALEGANVRKLSIAGMAISAPVFIVGVALSVLAIMGLVVPGLGIIMIAALLIMGSLTFFMAGSLFASSREQPDFSSRAVLYLADKIEKEPSIESAPEIILEARSDSKQLFDTKSSPGVTSSPVSQPTSQLDHKKLLDEFFDSSLKPALEKIYGTNNTHNEVLDSLKNGLRDLYNQDMPIDKLKSNIDAAVPKDIKQESLTSEAKQTYLTNLYQACGVKPTNLTPTKS